MVSYKNCSQETPTQNQQNVEDIQEDDDDGNEKEMVYGSDSDQHDEERNMQRYYITFIRYAIICKTVLVIILCFHPNKVIEQFIVTLISRI